MRISRRRVAPRATRSLAPVTLLLLTFMSVACGRDSAPTSPTADLTVTIAPLGFPSLFLGQTVRLTAVARDAQHRATGSYVMIWTRDNDGVTLSPVLDSLGRSLDVTAVKPGTTVLTATAGTASATIAIPVRPPGPVATIDVVPAVTEVVGASYQLAPVLRDADGVLLTGRVVTYTTSDATVGLVSASGVVTGAAPGEARITVSSEGRSTSLSLTVNAYPRAFLWTPTSGMTELGALPGFTYSSASGINASGQVVGESWTVSATGDVATGRAFRWSAATGMVALAQLPDAAVSAAVAINAAGVAAGWSATAAGLRHAVLWDANGAARDLGTLPGETSSQANAIDDNGRVVGWSGQKAFMWTAAIGMVELPAAAPSHAMGITGTATEAIIVGDLTGKNGVMAPYRWTPALGTQLLPLLETGTLGSAVAINSAGEIVGTSAIDCGYYCSYYGTVPPRVIFWSATGIPLDLAALVGATPTAMNSAGQIVGALGGHAFLWSKSTGTVRDLGVGAHHGSSIARGINDAGQVVGGNQ